MQTTDIELELMPQQKARQRGKPSDRIRNSVLAAIKLGGHWFTFSITSQHKDTPGSTRVTFADIGWWDDKDDKRGIGYWPTDHPDDVAKLTSLIFAAIVEGKLCRT